MNQVFEAAALSTFFGPFLAGGGVDFSLTELRKKKCYFFFSSAYLDLSFILLLLPLCYGNSDHFCG